MDLLHFSRMCKQKLVVPPRLRGRLEFLCRKNVVSHVTCNAARLLVRDRVYGRRSRPEIVASRELGCHSIAKFGSSSRHYRINTRPSSRNYGKFLVFASSNMIRAGKYTHAGAMRNTLIFTEWVRRAAGQRLQWHAAMSAPNMVISGKLKGALPEHVKDHWSATHTSKFPGIAISTPGSCTPEMYASGAFIIPGVATVESLTLALEAMDRALHDDAPPPACTSCE